MPSKNHSKGKPWRARIRWSGKDLYLGTFDSYDDAKVCELEARRKLRSRQGQNHWLRDRNKQGQFI